MGLVCLGRSKNCNNPRGLPALLSQVDHKAEGEHKPVRITGTPEAVEACKAMVTEVSRRRKGPSTTARQQQLSGCAGAAGAAASVGEAGLSSESRFLVPCNTCAGMRQHALGLGMAPCV